MILVLAGAALLLVGCAAIAPEEILPAASSTRFDTMGCDEIAAEKARIEEALVPLYNRQRQIRRNDLATSLLTAGVVAGNSLISDNQAPQEIAKLKGEGVALNDAIALQGCRIPAVKMPAPPKPKAPDKCVNGNPYCYG